MSTSLHAGTSMRKQDLYVNGKEIDWPQQSVFMCFASLGVSGRAGRFA